jgi:hypothetical protein
MTATAGAVTQLLIDGGLEPGGGAFPTINPSRE